MFFSLSTNNSQELINRVILRRGKRDRGEIKEINPPKAVS